MFDRNAISALWCRFGGVQLAAFGLSMTGRFNPARSDVDFLVEFRDNAIFAFAACFGLKMTLEGLVDKPVDPVSHKRLRNPYFAARVREIREELCAA